ncbi:hypothetical protein HRM2_25350 [Desulforapulum autotrophicum HRM2]|uniref:O-antigen ligase-related domain-containing protein n=2 Tax=Desulforapulum autotrophicum TaxID=2296 RepID=C0QGY0_DESAH|nr:hypothetical protein HRM2_25350 [Desulforapulum autotrophicum HRM2]
MKYLITIISIYSIFNNFFVFKLGIIDLRGTQLGVMCLLYITALKFLRRDLKFRFYSNDKFLIGFTVVVFFGCLFHKNDVRILRESVQWVYFMLLYIVFRNYFQKPSNTQFFINIFLKTTYLILLIGFIDIIFFNSQILTSTINLSWLNRTNEIRAERLSLFNLGPVATAATLMTILFMYLSLKMTKNRAFFLVCFGFIFLILCTKSRAAFGICGLVLSFYLYKNLPTTLFSNLIRYTYILIILATPLLISSFFVFKSFTDDMSFRFHYVVWLGAWKMFIGSPILGVGSGLFYENITHYSYLFDSFNLPTLGIASHNFILNILSENGMLGALFMFLFLQYFYQKRILKNSPTTILAVSSLLLMNLTMNIFMVDFFWIILAYHSSQIKPNLDATEPKKLDLCG